ncbi:hypothetical protein SAMN04488523_13111 [Sulfitobacter brevis]|uniref:Uncharacterized protein n=1 Tax=Sulfitobacter brevis TaxID=74348 RepID=A0A1I2GWK3_9RHOB|nr:hypothetical protein [Sulfitobacter brevis]SFF21520.1 hypothetical protein SAMN04488523_13111 [Sulfitobacter brevis]
MTLDQQPNLSDLSQELEDWSAGGPKPALLNNWIFSEDDLEGLRDACDEGRIADFFAFSLLHHDSEDAVISIVTAARQRPLESVLSSVYR